MIRRIVLVGVLVVGAAAPAGTGAASPLAVPTVAEPASSAGSIEPLTPARVLDTRDGTGVDAAGPVGPDESIDLTMTGAGGVPETGVAGVVLNVTVTQPTEPSFVTVWPTGEQLPTASSLNMLPGQTVPNLVIAKLGTDGKVSLFNKFGSTHLIADVAGWIPEGSDLTTLTPARILDTREPIGVAAAAPVGTDGVVELAVTGVGGVPDTGVGAVVLNVTVTSPTAPSFVTVWPTGEALPTASSLNMQPNQTAPNLVIAKVGDDGKVSLFNKFGTTHLIADVVAYSSESATLNPLTPARLLDTRDGTGAPTGAVGPDGVISLDVLDRGGVPANDVVAVVLNVTATAPTEPSFITAWPTGVPQPDASALNMMPGETVPNLAIMPVGSGGHIDLFNKFGSTHLIADVVAYITPPSGENAPVVADDTVVAPPGSVLSIDGDPDGDAPVSITLSQGVSAEVGTVIVSEPVAGAPSGLLRRVVSVTHHLDGSRTVVTEQAVIGEVFVAGSIDFEATADGATVRFVEATKTDFDAEMSCGAEITLTTDVTGDIEPTVGFQMDWNDDGLQRAQVTAGLDVALNFTAKASEKISCEASKTLAVITFTPIVIPVAGFPLVFVPEVVVDIKLAGEIEATIDGSAQYGVNMTAGLIYDSVDGVSTVGNATPFVTSTWQAGATAKASVTLTPALTILAYGLGGPRAGFPMAVSADIDVCRTPFWKITSSIKPTFSLALANWLGGSSIADTTYTLNENVIAQGGTPPAEAGCNLAKIVHYDILARGEAHTDTTPLVGEKHLDNAIWFAEVGETPSRLERTKFVTDWGHTVLSGSTDAVVTSPYDGAIATVDSISVTGFGDTASASASLTQTGDSSTSTLTASISAATTLAPTHIYPGPVAVASVKTTFETDRDVNLTTSTCAPDGTSLAFKRLSAPTETISTGPCIGDMVLVPGTYELFVFASSNAVTAGGSQTFTLTINPAP